MGTAEVSLAEIYDPMSPDQLADPYQVYKLAREREPIFLSNKVLRDAGVWVLTRYDDIAAVGGDDELFSSRDALRPLVPIYPATYEVLGRGYPLGQTTVEVDGPRHRRTSVPLKQVLSPRTAVLQEEFISSTVERLIDEMTAGGRREADIAGQFAHELPFRVINHLYGVPESDHDQIREWCDGWMRFLSTDLSPEAQVQAVQGMENYFYYVADLVRERRRHPREDDLVTLFAQHHEPGFEPLSEAELVNNLGGILLAGHVTTRTLIGNAVQILLARRGYWDDIIASPEHIPAIINEVLRYRTPTKAFFRTATRDTVLNGVKIAEGELLQLLFGSANHDEAKWRNPEVFDPWADRQGIKLMSFGYGPHYCVGASLACTEARIALEILSRRLPGLRLADQEYRYLGMVIIHGFERLMVEW